MSSDGRRFSEGQTTAILERAADLSARESKDGLSLDELEGVGHEVGVEAVHVRRAAGEVLRPASSTILVGVRHESVIDGELDDTRRQAIFHAVRTHLPTARAKTLGDIMIFESITGVTVSVASAKNRTRVIVARQQRVQKKAQKALGFAVLFGGVASVVGMGADDLMQAGMLLGIIAAMTVPAIGIAFLIQPLTKRIEAHAQRSMLELFHDVTAAAEEPLLAAPVDARGPR